MPHGDGWRGARLHYEDAGRGAPIVLVHGWMGDLRLWRPLAKRLAADHRVVAYSRRGHGASTAPGDDWSVEADARDLACLLESLELEDPVVVGWSMGGGVVLRFAEQHGFQPPAAGLGLLSTTPRYLPGDDWPLGERAWEVTRRAAAAAEAGGRDAVLDVIEDVMLHPHGDAGSRRLVRQVLADARREVVNPNGRSFSGADYRGLLPRVRTPAAVLHGHHDAYFPFEVAEWMAQALPRGRLFPLEAGHAPPLTAPHALAEALREFAATVGEGNTES